MVSTFSKQEQSLDDLGISFIDEVKGVQEYRLKNGLKVLLVENHIAPVITFLVLYKVGSRNEGVGFTGATHFLEHMLFKGTKKHNPDNGNGIDDLLTQIGAYWNATTWFDRTCYFEVVPSEFLELCVKLEADRMRNLLLRQEDRDSEMSVVRNELERGENYPEEALEKELYAVAFREHPYHHPTIGWRSDVEGVAMSRLKQFYDTFYWPNNATVVLLGDFQTKEALMVVEKHYGKIKSSPEPIPSVYTVEPPQEGERRFEIVRAGDLPRVWVGFHIPEAGHDDTYSLAAIRHILGSTYERSSRLYKSLIDSGIASDVFCRHDELRDPGLFFVGAALNPGQALEHAESVILKELEKLAREPVAEEELARAKSANLKGTVLTKADPSSLAFLLGESESKADWHWLMDYDDKFEAVTRDDIMKVATRYFIRSNRTVGQFKPLQHLIEKSDSPDTSVESSNEAEESVSDPMQEAMAVFSEPEPVEVPLRAQQEIFNSEEVTKLLAAPPPAVKVKFSKRKNEGATFHERVRVERLSNGMKVLLMQNPGTGSVGIAVHTTAGRYFTHKEKGSVSELVGELLPRGSQRFSKLQIAEALETMGTPAGLEFSVDNYRMGLSAHVVREDMSEYLDLLGDVMRRPLFAADELDKVKIEWSSKIVESANNTRAVAWNGLKRALYPEEQHPFHEKTFREQLEELNQVKRDDLVDVHQRLLSPRSTIIALVGDIDMDAGLEEIRSRFEDWTGEEPSEIIIPEAQLPPARRCLEMHIPDKSSVDILISHPTSLRRTNSDFYSARIANAALGQDTITSRLGQVVRDRAGLTYGIYSMFSDTAFGGAPWSVLLSVNSQNIDKALYLVDRLLSDYMERGISEEELARETGRAVGTFRVGLASSIGIARVLVELEFLGLGARELDLISQRYLSVTKDSADKAMKKYLHPQCMTTAISGSLR